MAALESQIRRLQQEPLPDAGPAPSIETPSIEALFTARFQAEERDTSWAPVAEQDFRSDLHRIGARAGFSVEEVTCQKTICRVALKWPNWRRASDGGGEIVHGEFKQNCGRASGTPPSEAKPYRQSVWFDCQNLRSPKP